MFTRLAAALSHSRSYSTTPNKPIIDFLTRCNRASHRSQYDTHLGRRPGLKEEDSSPSRNGYKTRSFRSAIAAIYEHKEPIRSGKEAIKVRPLAPSTLTPLFMPPQLRGVGLGIANRIEFFLQGKEDVCRRVQAGAPDICLVSDTLPLMQDEGLRDRLLTIEAIQTIPGIGYASLSLTYCHTRFS